MSELVQGVAAKAPGDSASSHRTNRQYVVAIITSPAFLPGIAVIASLCFVYWNLLKTLLPLYLDSEGYYSHGFFMPLTACYAISRNWSKLVKTPVKPSWWALIPLAILVVLLRPAIGASLLALMSVMLIFSMLAGVWFVAGWRWMVGVASPICYLLLGLPVWSMAINTYTNPLQLLSTRVAFYMLKLTQFSPMQDGTVIHLDHFNLDVGVPCSGLKLIVALSAFTWFFMMIARLKPWANLLLAGLVLPMALFFNGLRIAMIGGVGEVYGDAAGHQFHDYSGYIMLLICFFSFYKIARWLGWKD